MLKRSNHRLSVWMLVYLFFPLFYFILASFQTSQTDIDVSAMSLFEVQSILGNEQKMSRPTELGSAEIGKSLVLKGFANMDGVNSKPVSKFFVCATCHNQVKEFQYPSMYSPEDRLSYAMSQDIPFLQGSSFYGIVNRTQFFNGDYEKKYGNEVDFSEARKNLRDAIQFCSKHMSRGRKLNEIEIESILKYFWTLDLKIKDLQLNSEELAQLQKSVDNGKSDVVLMQMLDRKYVKNFSATFLPIPSFSSEILNSKEINLDHGKFIFERACMHCHEKGNYSFYHLDRSKMTFKHLEQAARSENYIFSMFYLVREGLEPRKGHQSHMPLFTAERMSPQQLNSLYAYVYSVSR